MKQKHADFEALVLAHGPVVLAYALRRARRADAEDAVAETFAVAWRRAGDVPAQPVAWLLGVARNVLLTQRRGEARRQRLHSRMTHRDSALVWDPEPDDHLSADLRRALGSLTVAEREALLLIAWDELSVEEASIVMQCRPGAFRTRLHRARVKVQDELARAQDAPAPMHAQLEGAS